MSVQLGETLKDRITGFTGVVLGYVVYISGCNQALLAPPVDKDGKHVSSHWFDEQRLVHPEWPKKKPKKKREPVVLDNVATPGAADPAPTK